MVLGLKRILFYKNDITDTFIIQQSEVKYNMYTQRKEYFLKLFQKFLNGVFCNNNFVYES
ncbi:MAG: hypothetical protein JWQ40_1433 [Segetibacter sp.]|nr:hypothetical protein [Segetibacter sp.]